MRARQERNEKGGKAWRDQDDGSEVSTVRLGRMTLIGEAEEKTRREERGDEGKGKMG